MNAITKEYNRLRNNLNRQIKSMEKRGYFFPAGSPLPDRPKRITKASVRRLESIKSDLYRKARYLDPETGLETSGRRGQEIERERTRKKAWKTRRREEGGGGGEPPVYTMYNTIKTDLLERQNGVYTRSPSSRKVIRVSFSHEIRRCLDALEKGHKADQYGYEEYLSNNEEDIMSAVEGSRVLADFMSDISEIQAAYAELFNLLSGYPVDTPMVPVKEDEGFLTDDDFEGEMLFF